MNFPVIRSSFLVLVLVLLHHFFASRSPADNAAIQFNNGETVFGEGCSSYFAAATATTIYGDHKVNFNLDGLGALPFNTMCIVLFVVHIIRYDLPLSSLPIIGKKFKKTK